MAVKNLLLRCTLPWLKTLSEILALQLLASSCSFLDLLSSKSPGWMGRRRGECCFKPECHTWNSFEPIISRISFIHKNNNNNNNTLLIKPIKLRSLWKASLDNSLYLWYVKRNWDLIASLKDRTQTFSVKLSGNGSHFQLTFFNNKKSPLYRKNTDLWLLSKFSLTTEILMRLIERCFLRKFGAKPMALFWSLPWGAGLC